VKKVEKMNAVGLEPKPAEERYPCIWMQAGVVRKKFCRHNYDCTACRFDRAMRRVALENLRRGAEVRFSGVRRTGIVFWQDRLKELPPWKRPCLHHLKRRINFRACNQNYQCGNCEFDQYFSDQYTVHAVVQPIAVRDVKGFKHPYGYYLHRGHAWVKIEESAAVRVGLDDFALRLLGPLDQIEAPLMGKEIRQDNTGILLRRGANEAGILAPVSGVVTAVNPDLREEGKLANRDPYTAGWVLRVHSTNLRQDLKHLMIGDQAGDFLDEEIEQLHQLIEEEAGLLAADGGCLEDDIYGNLPRLDWRKLTRLFLHT
jgi:glycine cleavage system H lipoate-binding protein